MSHKRDDRREDKDLKRIETTEHHELAELRAIRHDLDLLVGALVHPIPVPISVTIQQLQGDTMNPITGVNAGGNNSFGITTSPAGSVFATGTTFLWAVDDTADISITPSTDGLSVATACSATPAQTSFNLTFTATPMTGPVVTATVNVPILPATAPIPTSVTIGQIS